MTTADRIFAGWRRRRWRGFNRAWSALRGPQARLRFRTRYGSEFALNPTAYIDGIVIEDGFYESEVLEALRAALSPAAVLWDIGANFGLHAITAACLAPEATVVAFEPNPAEHARLLLHRAWNAPRLITCALALSDRTGVLPLHLGDSGNSGMTTLEPWSEARYTGVVNVAVLTGDELVARGSLPAPTLIKLDVEGHEAAVLRGLATVLARPSCTLVVFEDHPTAESEAKRLLRAAGFAIAPLARREHSDHALVNFAARKSPR